MGTEKDIEHEGRGPGGARDQGPAESACPMGRAPAQTGTPGWGQQDGDTTLGVSLGDTGATL